MELSFQVSIGGVRITGFDPAKTSSSEAVARYISDVEKRNNLEEGTLRDAIIASTPFGTRLWETSKTGSFVPQPAPLNMRLDDAFGDEGGTYLLEVKPELLKYFLVGSPASVRKKNKKKKKTKRGDGNADESATNVAEEPTDPTDRDDDDITSHAQVQSSSADFEQKLLGMREMMENMQKMLDDERDKANAVTARLEQALDDERNKANAVTARLEQVLDDERNKANAVTARLEQALDDERTQSQAKMSELAEALKKQKGELDAVKETVEDTAEWIGIGCPQDSVALRRIKLRNLLDCVQARLAFCIGRSTQPYMQGASARWRESVEGHDTAERLGCAKTLLEDVLHDPSTSNSVKSGLRKFILSNEAMVMAVEQKSKLWEDGDQVAHYNLTESQFSEVVKEHCQKGGKNEGGLNAFVDFLFS